MRHILGVDFDNTIVDYDEILWKTAQRLGFIAGNIARNKKSIRGAIRALPDGERKWQQVQAHAYGKAMDEAILIDGVASFFQACRRAGVATYIVSHKTQFAAQDTDKTDLRQTALEWMNQQKFFEPEGLGFSKDHVFFEATRREKVERIKRLGCTHFIDDLEETFMEKVFPKDVRKILYAPGTNGALPKDITVMSNWRKIHEYFFSQGR